MKRITVFILIISLFAMSLLACGNDSSDNGNVVQQQNIASDEGDDGAAVQDPKDLDDLGEFDFKGHEFKILNRTSDDWTQARLDFSELTGEVFQDEIYLRNRRLEERFNVKISIVETTDRVAARPILLAGTNDYDMYTSRNAEVFTLAQEGLINNINSLDYIDLTKNYWNDFLTEQLTVTGKKYFAVGDFDFSSLDYCFILVFNKELIQNYGLENPFDLVKKGTWTFDKFAELSKTGTVDLNGDGAMDDKDAWGYACRPNDVLPGFWIGGGVKGAEKDSNDIPQNMMGTQKFIDVVDKIFEITHGNNIYYNSGGTMAEGSTLFTNGNILFYGTTLFNLKNLRNMDTDFGILPYPKYTEKQDKYYTRLGGGELFFTAKSATKEGLDRASVILESMACESRKTCLPAYYDLVLKTKLARDVESEEIIDSVVAHRVFDYVDTLWVNEFRDGPIAVMFGKKSNTLVSLSASLEKIFDTKRDSLVEAFLELED